MKHRKIIIFIKLKFIIGLSNIDGAFMLVHITYCSELFWSKLQKDLNCFENKFEVALR